MSKDNAPIGNTCPMIDDVIRSIDYIKDRMSPAADDDIHDDFKNALSVLEDVRSANSTLREWGNDQHNRADDFEGQADHLEAELRKLRSELEDRERDIKDLENDKAVLELELEHMQKQID